MTKQRSFKRLVRLRMDKTGESYTTARRVLLVSGDGSTEAGGSTALDAPGLVCPDAVVRERTGRGWEEWFDLLDQWGAETMTHRDIARKVAADLGIDPLGWGAQAVAVSYERGKGLRAVGERADGFAVSASRTVAVPADRLFASVADPDRRAGWLPDADLRERGRNGTSSVRFDRAADGSRVTVYVAAAGPARAKVSVEHTRLADAGTRARLKPWWGAALDVLKARLEGGAADA
jgi:hypothetical protein